jgi:(S)-citramalyl-CoA lyase
MSDTKTHRMRSWLFTPATRPDRFEKATTVGADILILDLEDAVAQADKEMARATALDYLSHANSTTTARALRVNGLETAAGLADLNALIKSDASPDLVVLPKTESATHLIILDRLLSSAGKTARLVAIIESASGLSAVEDIARATPRLAALLFGAADMAADLSAEPTWEPLLYTRSRIVAACEGAGVTAVDTPYFDIHDSAGLKEELTRSRAAGFSSKAAIHPNQVEAINSALTPTAQAVAEARAILAENKKGVGVVNGRMVDEAVARKARRVLAAVGEKS